MNKIYIPKYLFSDEIVSMTECTGLMPTLPVNEPEVESYNDIYPVAERPSGK